MQQVDELKTANAGDGHENVAGPESSKVAFDPEQQAKVQQLIDEAYRKAYAKAQRAAGSGEEVKKLKSEVDSLREEKKMSALLRVISKHNVVDAGEVAELLKNRIKLDDDGNVTVVGSSGSTWIDSSGRPMGLDEFIGHWLGERPHHLRPTGPAGAGSSGARYGGTSAVRHNLADPAAWRTMPREDLDRILREGVNVQGAAGQTYRFKDVRNPFLEAKKQRYQNRDETKVRLAGGA